MNRSTTKKRILIADDHPMVREWLAQLINLEPDLIVCGEAGDAPQTLRAIQATRPDLAIVDLSMDGTHGVELIQDITARYERVPVLVLSMHDESLYAERAIHAGARGYITKREGGAKIKQAIRRVLAGDIYVSEKIDAKILKQATAGHTLATAAPVESLSGRELEVFELLGCGLGPSQIADELHLSVKTVEGYAGRIKEKLLLKDARELHQYAIQWNKLGEAVPPANPSQPLRSLPGRPRIQAPRHGAR